MRSVVTALLPAWAFAQPAEALPVALSSAQPSSFESSSVEPSSAEPAVAAPAQPPAPTAAAAPASPAEPATPVVTVGGYIEEYYQLQLQDASNRITNLGTSSWAAVAGYAKLQLSPQLYGVIRADYFYEKVAADNGTTASAIFCPVKWLAEATATLSYQPIDHGSLRLEHRHDQAADNAFFGGDVTTDAVTQSFVPNRKSQDTVTLGVTAWF